MGKETKDAPKKRGRPVGWRKKNPTKLVYINIVTYPEVRKAIDRVRGKTSRSQWVEELILAKLGIAVKI